MKMIVLHYTCTHFFSIGKKVNLLIMCEVLLHVLKTLIHPVKTPSEDPHPPSEDCDQVGEQNNTTL